MRPLLKSGKVPGLSGSCGRGNISRPQPRGSVGLGGGGRVAVLPGSSVALTSLPAWDPAAAQAPWGTACASVPWWHELGLVTTVCVPPFLALLCVTGCARIAREVGLHFSPCRACSVPQVDLNQWKTIYSFITLLLRTDYVPVTVLITEITRLAGMEFSIALRDSGNVSRYLSILALSVTEAWGRQTGPQQEESIRH